MELTKILGLRFLVKRAPELVKLFTILSFFLHTEVGIVGHFQRKVEKSRSTEKIREK